MSEQAHNHVSNHGLCHSWQSSGIVKESESDSGYHAAIGQLQIFFCFAVALQLLLWFAKLGAERMPKFAGNHRTPPCQQAFAVELLVEP